MANNQFVTFKIDDNLLGINILNVREINKVLDATPVQHSPNYVWGLVNLRGQTVTVFDLGIRLGLEQRILNIDSHNIILKKDSVGFLVDNIGDVIEIEEERIEPPPANIEGIQSKYIEGIAKLDNELLIILSADKIIEHN
ncbi:MAG: chemotaxis protein CheW [Desulfobacterales bacterium]|nr:chemotaxis protein CheW [Desulfobacterales bacterium]MBF0397006.1 chemotaxis protein CheW [Desulfobacterales bacterium]